MRMKREELYEYLRDNCFYDYSIGLHGIDVNRYKDINREYEDRDYCSEIVNAIINNGLRVYSDRTINGTVRFFGRLNSKNDMEDVFNGLSNYSYGGNDTYIIVAVPVELKDGSGNKLFIGKTNLDSEFKEFFDTTGSEVSCLGDAIILDNQMVPKEFILGSFKVVDRENEIIDVSLNPNHIVFNNNILSDSMFQQYQERANTINTIHGTKEVMDFLTGKGDKIDDFVYLLLFKNCYYLLETVKQLRLNDNIQELSEEDLAKLEELKKEYREILEENKRYRRERKIMIERMKNHSLDEICRQALDNFSDFSQYPEEIRNDVSLMREVAKTDGVKSIIMYYVLENVQNDLIFHLNLLKHGDLNLEYDYVFYNKFNLLGDNSDMSLDVSDFCNSYVGIDVRCEEIFWETLNEVLKEHGFDYPFYDVEKEVRIAQEEKAKLSRGGR